MKQNLTFFSDFGSVVVYSGTLLWQTEVFLKGTIYVRREHRKLIVYFITANSEHNYGMILI